MNLVKVETILSAVSNALTEYVLRKTGQLYIVSGLGDSVYLPSPPLVTNCRLLGVDLKPLAKAVHGSVVIEDRFYGAFEAFRHAKSHRADCPEYRRLVDVCDGAAPGLGVNPAPGTSALAALIQTMYALGFQGHDVHLGKGRIYLDTGVGRWTIYQRAIESPNGYKRLPTSLGCRVESCLTAPLNSNNRSTNRVGAIYRYLTRTFPALHTPLEIVFGTAIKAHLQFHLLSAFVVVEDRYGDYEAPKQNPSSGLSEAQDKALIARMIR